MALIVAAIGPVAGCAAGQRPAMTLDAAREARSSYRLQLDDPDRRLAWRDAMIGAATAPTDASFDLLALSGGGADGAYGAGVLVGWGQSGDRPVFEVVTGVSTGALMAPFAFIGAEGDAELQAAFVDGRSSGLLRNRGVMAFYGPGLFDQRPIRNLVEQSTSPSVVEAVARAHRQGRRLYVATTSLDSQSQTVWDMGALAASDLPDRRARFVDILIASSCIPGVFPPVALPLDDAGRVTELHADGRTTHNFFVAPEEALLETDLFGDAPGHVWIVINGRPEGRYITTAPSGLSVAARGLDAMMKASTRLNLIAARQ
ncbi:MAG: phospholipase, partial [Brevundimonas sp.]